MSDRETISREWYELDYASNALGVSVSTVLKALEDLFPNNKREDVYAYINAGLADNTRIHEQIVVELQRAEFKHSWEGNSVVKMALIVIEEAGEVARASLQHDEEGGSVEAIREELIQTGAMCYRMLKNLPKDYGK